MPGSSLRIGNKTVSMTAFGGTADSSFNPGQTFTAAGYIFYDDDFIWIRDNTLYGKDYHISSTYAKGISLWIQE